MSHRRDIPDLREDCEAILARVKQRVTVIGKGCWIWNGFRDGYGYGHIGWRNRPWTISRLIYAAVNGPFDKDMDVCHRCDRPPCCNPEHLFLGTHRENMRDCSEKGRWPKQASTHCRRGHEYTAENTYYPPSRPNRRTCRECERLRHRGGPLTIRGALRTHCPSGHAYDKENTYVYRGNRYCRACRNERRLSMPAL